MLCLFPTDVPSSMHHSFLSTLLVWDLIMRFWLCFNLLLKIFITFCWPLKWPKNVHVTVLLTGQAKFLRTTFPSVMISSGLWQYQAPFSLASGILYPQLTLTPLFILTHSFGHELEFRMASLNSPGRECSHKTL